MSNFNYFVTSSSTKIVLDAVTLCDRRRFPPQNYWVFSGVHSLSFYKAECIEEEVICRSFVDHSVDPQTLQRSPHFSVELNADIVRMVKWSPATALSNEFAESPPKDGLLLLTESSVLYLVEPDFKCRTLKLISKVDLSDLTAYKTDTIPLVSLDPNYEYISVYLHKALLHIIRIQQKKLFNHSTITSYRLRPPVQLRIPQIYPLDMHFSASIRLTRNSRSVGVECFEAPKRHPKRRRSDASSTGSSCQPDCKSTSSVPSERITNASTIAEAALPSNDLLILFNTASKCSALRRINIGEYLSSAMYGGDYLGADWNTGNEITSGSPEIFFPLTDGTTVLFGLYEISVLNPNGDTATAKLPYNQKLKGPLHAASLNVSTTIWLLGDSTGRFLLVGLEPKDGPRSSQQQMRPPITTISFASLGSFCAPSCIVVVSPMSNSITLSRLQSSKAMIARSYPVDQIGKVFIGSISGDPVVLGIEMGASVDDRSNAFELYRFPNLGPIIDLLPVDPQNNGQLQLLLATGYAATGSVRIAMPGMGVSRLATGSQKTSRAGLKRIFPIHSVGCYEKAAVGILETGPLLSRVRKIRDECGLQLQIEEYSEASSFILSEETLHCGKIFGNNSMMMIQITPSYVRVLDLNLVTILHESSFQRLGLQQKVELCSVNGNLVTIASGNRLAVLSINEIGTSLDAELELDEEIAAISACANVHLVAAITWDNNLSLYRVTPKQLVNLPHNTKIRIQPNVTATDVCLVQFQVSCSQNWWCRRLSSTGQASIQSRNNQLFLLIGFSDGSIVHGRVNDKDKENLSIDAKYIHIGTTPVSFSAILKNDDNSTEGLAICCNHPAVAFLNASSCRLQTTPLGLTSPRCIAPLEHLNNDVHDGRTVLGWIEDSVNVGFIEGIQRLQVKTMPLEMSPECISYHETTKSVVVGCIQDEALYSGEEDGENTGCLIITDLDFRSTLRYDLNDDEVPTAIACCTLGDDPRELVIVGSYKHEKGKGTIRILNMAKVSGPGTLRHHEIVIEEIYREETDLVSRIKCVNGQLLVAFGPKLKLYSLVSSSEIPKETSIEKRTALKCLTTYGTDFILDMDQRGSSILLGFLNRSASLYKIKQELDEHSLVFKEVASDYNPVWPRAVACQSETHFLESDDGKNLIALAPLSLVIADPESVVPSNTTRLEAKSHASLHSPELYQVGLFHCGESINRLAVSPTTTTKHLSTNLAINARTLRTQRASATRQLTGSLEEPHPTFWGSTEGALGMIIPIDSPKYNRLLLIQNAIAETAEASIGLSVSHYRDYVTIPRRIPHRGFIDGDTIEKLLDMEPSVQQAVYKKLNKSHHDEAFPSQEALLKEIEELSRSHF